MTVSSSYSKDMFEKVSAVQGVRSQKQPPIISPSSTSPSQLLLHHQAFTKREELRIQKAAAEDLYRRYAAALQVLARDLDDIEGKLRVADAEIELCATPHDGPPPPYAHRNPTLSPWCALSCPPTPLMTSRPLPPENDL